jgi:hypothetical protein
MNSAAGIPFPDTSSRAKMIRVLLEQPIDVTLVLIERLACRRTLRVAQGEQIAADVDAQFRKAAG